jgi:hypothetical protein
MPSEKVDPRAMIENIIEEAKNVDPRPVGS